MPEAQRKPEAQPERVVHGDCYQGIVPEERPAQDGGQLDGAVADASAKARPRGVLQKEDIRHRVREHEHEARRCYEYGLRHDPSLQGRLVYQWTIGATGSVVSSRLISSEMDAPEVETCLGRHICEWGFPSPVGGGTVTVTYPFVFQWATPNSSPATALNVNPARFKGYRSPHMLVHSDADRDAVHEVVQHLEEIYEAISSTYLVAKDSFPVELILFGSQWEFQKLSERSLQGIFVQARGRGVMMMPYKQGGLEWGPAGLRSYYLQVAVHEMAHRLLDDAMPHAPSWFHEGLASFLETTFIRQGSVWYGLPTERIMSTLAASPILPLQDLLATGLGDDHGRNARYYATAWLLLNYLLVGNDGREVSRYRHLWERLQDDPRRRDWSGTVTDIFGKPLAQIEAGLQLYADTKIVGHVRTPRLRQMAVKPIGNVPLRDRESDPLFVQEACRTLQGMYEKKR